METIEPAGDAQATARTTTRWVPSAILDLPPGEHVTALCTPHRVMLQALPSRAALSQLLAPKNFEIQVDLDDDDAPLRQAPTIHLHGPFLAADLPIEWPLFYWLVDGLQEDLEAADPIHAFERGRARLALAEKMLRRARRHRPADVDAIAAAWESPPEEPEAQSEPESLPDPLHYVRELARFLVDHAQSSDFIETVRPWLAGPMDLAALGARETRMLGAYAQHRLFGAAWLASPAGLAAGWQIFVATQVMTLWFAQRALASPRGKLADALMTSFWLLDQGLWRDSILVHELARTFVSTATAAPEFTAALAGALRAAAARA
jgi:hypothetical protein